MKAVLDTNVFVSAFLSAGSPPDRIVRAWRRGDFELVTSAPILSELEAVLARPHIAKRLGWNAEEQTATIAALSDAATVVVPTEKITAITSDPSDNRILEAAVAVQADYIVSGDSDLLNLHVFEGMEIVTPARFAAILQGR
jgi:putative PIN family toxin of toxin-antitoxin system